jgi:hypothetical protein
MNIKFTLEIDYDIMDEITRQNLKSAYPHADSDELRDAIDLVIEYFSNQADYQKWVDEKLNYTK